MEQAVPDRWRFSLDSEDVSLRDLSWPEARRMARANETGDLAAQSDGECVQLEFNATHAAVLYMGRDGIIRWPYRPNSPTDAQDITPYFCKCCGIRIGSQDGYLARFFERADGFRLFEAVLRGPTLPAELPRRNADQPVIDRFEVAVDEWAITRVLEWRPLPSGAGRHS